MSIRLFVAMLAAVPAGTITLAAQTPGAAAVIAGRVADSAGAPLAAARVTAVGADRAAATDDSGRFTLRALPAGRYALVVAQIGYLPVRRAVELRGGDTA